MKYVSYSPTTKEITAWGECDIPVAIGDNLTLAAEGSPATHYVTNGALVKYTTLQAAAKAAMPSYAATWSNTSFSWVDSRTLSEAQAETWENIRNARDTNLAAGFTWNGSKFDSDDISIQRIMGAVQLATLALGAGQSFTIVWTLFDNSTLTLSGSDMINVYVALGNFTQACFTAGVNLREQISAATTTSQLDAISWVPIS